MCHSLVAGVAMLLGVDPVVYSKLSPSDTPKSRTWVCRWGWFNLECTTGSILGASRLKDRLIYLSKPPKIGCLNKVQKEIFDFSYFWWFAEISYFYVLYTYCIHMRCFLSADLTSFTITSTSSVFSFSWCLMFMFSHLTATLDRLGSSLPQGMKCYTISCGLRSFFYPVMYVCNTSGGTN